jgi:hypothetical protein
MVSGMAPDLTGGHRAHFASKWRIIRPVTVDDTNSIRARGECPARAEGRQPPTLKGAIAFDLVYTQGRITAADLARELGCTNAHAYRVLQRLELSRRFSLVYERPYWYLSSG